MVPKWFHASENWGASSTARSKCATAPSTSRRASRLSASSYSRWARSGMANSLAETMERRKLSRDSNSPSRMPGLFQIVVGGEEKALKVPHEHIVERKHRVKEQRIDVLEPMQRRPGFVRRKAEDAASGKRVVFVVEIDAGVVASMMEDPPHIGADSTNIENIVQGFVYRPHR